MGSSCSPPLPLTLSRFLLCARLPFSLSLPLTRVSDTLVYSYSVHDRFYFYYYFSVGPRISSPIVLRCSLPLAVLLCMVYVLDFPVSLPHAARSLLSHLSLCILSMFFLEVYPLVPISTPPPHFSVYQMAGEDSAKGSLDGRTVWSALNRQPRSEHRSCLCLYLGPSMSRLLDNSDSLLKKPGARVQRHGEGAASHLTFPVLSFSLAFCRLFIFCAAVLGHTYVCF